jgi:hemoglobin
MPRFCALVLAWSVLLTSVPAAPHGRDTSLFRRLGGKRNIGRVVHDFIDRCSKDDRISSFFAATVADPDRRSKFESKLVEQICQASGGPCKYRGKTMKAAHAGMGIQSEHFDAMVENLTVSLNQARVRPADQQALLAKLEALKKEIVEPVRSTASQTK